MDKVERIGVSLEADLLAAYDALIAKKGYKNRSEALRDLIRGELSQARTEEEDAPALGVVLLVYDHHVAKLTERLLHLQHSNLLVTISTLHVHLDHHHCLEIIALRGTVAQINLVGGQMVSLKGVRLGRVNLIPASL